MTREQAAQAAREANEEQALVAEKMRHELDPEVFEELKESFSALARFKKRMKKKAEIS